MSKMTALTEAEVKLAKAIEKIPVKDRTAAEQAQLADIIGRLESATRYYRAEMERAEKLAEFLDSALDRQRKRSAGISAEIETLKRIVQAPDDDCAHGKGEIALIVDKMKLLKELREGPDRDFLKLPGEGVTLSLQKLIRKAEDHLAPLMDDRRTAYAFSQGTLYANVERLIDIEIVMEDRRLQKKTLAFDKIGARKVWADEWAGKNGLRLSDLKDGADTPNIRRWAKSREVDLSTCKRNPARKEFGKAFREEFKVSPDTVMRFLKPYIQ